MNNKLKKLSFLLLLFSAQLMAAEEIDYCRYSFDSEEMPADFRSYDVDNQPMHYSAAQYGFEQGLVWLMQREENVMPYNYFVATFSRHKAKTGTTEILPSNHWLVMPSVYVRHSSAKILWRSNNVTLNLEKSSTYSLRVSTTGNKPEDFTDEPLITINADTLDTWVSHEVSLAAYAGKRVFIAFVNTTNQGEMLAIDDIIVRGEVGDFSYTTNVEDYVYGVRTFVPNITFTQVSENKITAFTAHLLDLDTKNETKMSISKLNLPAGQSIELPLGNTYNVNYGDTLHLSIWLTVNDANTDAINKSPIFLSFCPEQHVVIETGTGTWCGWCPQGIVAMQRLKDAYADALVPICVHSNNGGTDPMVVSGYIGNNGISFPDGYPSGHINRRYHTVPLVETHVERKVVWSTLYGGYETYLLKALAEKPFAQVQLQAEIEGNKIVALSTTTCCIPKTNADLRIAYILTEDSWSSSTVAQKNYIPGQGYELDGWENKPQTIPGYVFKDVARGAADNAFRGINVKFPSTLDVDEPYEHQVQMSIPSAVGNIKNCSLSALLIDNTTGYIINSARVSLNPTGISLTSSPSPQSEGKVFNLNGQQIQHLQKGINIINGKKILF